MNLNKTAHMNLMYIGIVIFALMLIPLLKKTEFARGRRRRRRNREREATVMRGTGVNESARSKARRKAKTCKYLSSPRARKKMGC
jgi:hypothetical protein